MKNVSVERVDMNTICPKLTKQWAECYCEIWKEAPWNENFWQPESVIADFRKEMQNRDATAFLAIHNGLVVGFTHGYSVNRQELQSIAENNQLDSIFEEKGRIFYVDELGVTAQYRGNRISIALTTALMEAVQTSGIKIFVLRTDTKAVAARYVYQKLRFKELDVRDTAYPERTYWFLDIHKRKFMDLFQFDPAKVLLVGVEREAFLTNDKGVIIPQAHIVINNARHCGKNGKSKIPTETIPDERFGYELSACQVESRIGPCKLVDLSTELLAIEDILKRYLMTANVKVEKLQLSHIEVGPEDMPLDVYPDPSGRYQEIVKTMPRHVLLAACRVIGTHIHIGMPDHETAMKAYNHVIKKSGWLCSRGNGSFGERLDIYRTVAPDCDPLPYKDWVDFHRVACAKGFDNDPRKCWTLIRISKHGTIEFRMFGATSSIERIVGWVKLCHDLCAEVII